MIFSRLDIGIDIGSKNVKLVIYNGDILDYYIIKLDDGVVKNGHIVDIKSLYDKLVELFHKKKIKGNISFVVTCTDIIIREITIPNMDESELKGAVRFEAERYIPTSLDNYIIDYKVLSKNDTEQSVLFVASPDKLIDEYIQLASSLKMRIKSIDIFPNAVIKGLKFFKKDLSEINAIIDIGYNYSNVLMINDGIYSFYREIPYGEIYLAPLLLQDKPDSESKSIIPGLNDNSIDSFLRELDVIFNYYTTRSRKNVKNIHLIGGASNLNGLKGVIKNYFNVEVSSFDTEQMKLLLPALGCVLREE